MRTHAGNRSDNARGGAGRPRGRAGWALLALALLAAAATPAGAESPWSKVTRLLNPGAPPPVESPRGTLAGYNAEARMVTAERAPEVPDEVGTNFASLNPGQSVWVPSKSIMAGQIPGASGNRESKIDLGRESDDTENMAAVDLFKNPEMLRLLGEAPRFIYDPGQRPDPMLVPWVRNAAIFKELNEQAEACLAAGQVDQALSYFERIVALNDERFSAMVQMRLAEINKKRAEEQTTELTMAQAPEVKIELPAWVNENTNGVIISPDSRICLIGEYMLHPGETLPNFPEVSVTTIESKAITFQIQDKTFVVELSQDNAEGTSAETTQRASGKGSRGARLLKGKNK